jgi:tetratricopeptide (TPR) repeat protein
MALAGLGLTALALWGAVLAFGDVRAGRRRPIYVPLGLLALATLGAFALFAWRVPIWSALKASYLLGLSLPYGVFLARAAEQLAARRSAWLRFAPAAWVAVVAAAAGVIGAEGVVLPKRADAPATGAVRFYFGEYEGASRVYARLIAGAHYKVPWIENLAAVKLLEGHPDRARKLYARAVETGLPDPYRRGRLAVAIAVAGDLEAALAELDVALAADNLPELRANRGAIRAARGDFAGAQADLAGALAENSSLVPAWRNLALVLDRAGRPEESAEVWRRARVEACTGPRGYPYGIGTGEVLQWGIGRRWLLLVSKDGVRVAAPAFYRSMCSAFRGSSAPEGEGDAE